MPRRSTTELARTLTVTPQTARRLLAEVPRDLLLAAGQARRARYALPRALRCVLDDIPLYALEGSGQAELLASLALVHPHAPLLPSGRTPWPAPGASPGGWWGRRR